MLYQIHLVDLCQKHAYHFVEADSKELALNALVFNKKLDLTIFSLILVCDLSESIIKDTLKENILNVVMTDNSNKDSTELNDIVLDYSKELFTNHIKISTLTFTLFDALRHEFLTINAIKELLNERK